VGLSKPTLSATYDHEGRGKGKGGRHPTHQIAYLEQGLQQAVIFLIANGQPWRRLLAFRLIWRGELEGGGLGFEMLDELKEFTFFH
jgi:hypothetical protein